MGAMSSYTDHKALDRRMIVNNALEII